MQAFSFVFFFLELQDCKAGVMEFWLHSFPVLLIDRDEKYSFAGYSCLEKGCPTKPYATMPKDILGNEG